MMKEALAVEANLAELIEASSSAAQGVRLHALVDGAIDSAHRRTDPLPTTALVYDLTAALATLMREQMQPAGISYAFHQSATRPDIAPALATALLSVAQESCANICKHARATQVDLYLAAAGDMLVLELIDNGIGFALNTGASSGCSGLDHLRTRIESLGGTWYVASRPGKGTLVHAAVPIAATPYENDHYVT